VQCLGPQAPGLERVDYLGKYSTGSRGVTRGEIATARLDTPSGPAFRVSRRSETARTEQEIGRGLASTTLACRCGRLLERGRDRLVRLQGREREMARTLFRILDRRRQAAVKLSPARRHEQSVRSRREQRVGKAHALSDQLDDASIEGGIEIGVRLQEAKLRIGERCNRDECTLGSARKRPQSIADQPVQRRWHG
jgi:hypothetical protein